METDLQFFGDRQRTLLLFRFAVFQYGDDDFRADDAGPDLSGAVEGGRLAFVLLQKIHCPFVHLQLSEAFRHYERKA